jgi:hypothetical protein
MTFANLRSSPVSCHLSHLGPAFNLIVLFSDTFSLCLFLEFHVYTCYSSSLGMLSSTDSARLPPESAVLHPAI